jgi:RodZ C-terminal domain/PilZ domain
MDRRKEARFQVYAPAKVAPLDEPETEMDCQVIDISGLGLRFVADTEYQEDQIVTLDTDQHLILADVRNCRVRGARFLIGAERIHSTAKVSLPQTASKLERNEALVGEYHRRLRGELPPAEPLELILVPSEVQVIPAEPLATLAEPPTTPVEAHAAPEPEPPSQHNAILEEPPEASASPTTLTPAKPADIKLNFQGHSPFVAKPVEISSGVNPVHPETTPALPASPDLAVVASDAAPAEKPPETKTIAKGSAAAKGAPPIYAIDPIREAFIKSETEQPAQSKAKSRSRVLVVAIAAVCSALAVWVLWFGPFAKRAPLQTFADAQSSTPAVSSPAPAPVTTPAPTAPAPAPSPAPPAGQSTALLEASGDNWVTACSDGKLAFTKMFAAGSKENLMFATRAVVRVGNAGALEISLNGKSIGPLGRAGQVRVIELKPTSWSFLSAREENVCTQ